MALPMCPWALLSGATVYISVMGGYATFIGPHGRVDGIRLHLHPKAEDQVVSPCESLTERPWF